MLKKSCVLGCLLLGLSAQAVEEVRRQPRTVIWIQPVGILAYANTKPAVTYLPIGIQFALTKRIGVHDLRRLRSAPSPPLGGKIVTLTSTG